MNRLTLIWRNTTRKPVRYWLTSLSVLIAFYLFGIMAGIGSALDAKTSAKDEQRLMTSHKVSMTRLLPINYKNKILSLAEVEKVTYSSWFSGFFQNEKNQLAQFAVDADSYFSIYTEYQLESAQLAQWKNTRSGLIIGPAVAEKFNWQIGDKIPIQSAIWMNRDDSFTWEFEVSGIYQIDSVRTDANQVFFHHQYFDDYRAFMGNTTGWFTSQMIHASSLEKTTQAIDQLFLNSTMETKTTSEQVFMKELAQQFDDMGVLLKILLSAVFFTLLLITGNIMLQSIRERLDEIAMLKAIGFSSYRLILDTFFESVVLISLGAICGTLLALFTLVVMQGSLSQFLPGIEMTSQHYIQVLLSVGLFALICSAIPAVKIKYLAISQTLGAKI